MTDEKSGKIRPAKIRRRRFSHPLSGAKPGLLFRLASEYGLPRGANWVDFSAAMISSILKTPISLIERGRVGMARRSTPPVTDPIFIVGHWRSGTTHLYNIMSRSPGFGSVSPFATALPWDFLLMQQLFGGLLKRALPDSRYIDNVPVNADSPQEDEIALANMTPLSIYHALYFPRHFEANFNAGLWFDGCSREEIEGWKKRLKYFYLKLQIQHPGTNLLIKNPVYTTRVGMLAEMFPEAKFIHIHRNPYKVFFSMRNFYEKLLGQFALQPWDHIDIDEHIFSTYSRMMDDLERDWAAVPVERRIEVSFDELQKGSIEVLHGIYDTLELPRFFEALPQFESYLRTTEGYAKNVYEFPPDMIDKITERWGKQINNWQYEKPV